MVTRNRQRERENESLHPRGEENQRYRLADFASWQDKVFFNVTIPVLVPVPEPPAPKRIGKNIVDPSLKLKRAPKETNQGTMKLETGWYWREHYKNKLEWRTVTKNYAFLDGHWNYHQDSEWWRRHYEKEYEGEIDPVEV